MTLQEALTEALNELKWREEQFNTADPSLVDELSLYVTAAELRVTRLLRELRAERHQAS